MKIIYRSFLAAVLILNSISVIAQNTILPLNAAKVMQNGLKVRNVEVSMDGYLLTGNAVTLNKELVFKLLSPIGFTQDAQKKSYPAAEVTITTASGTLLGKTPDAFSATGSAGFTPDKFKELLIKTGLGADVVKKNTQLIINIILTDKKSKNNLKISLPVTITAGALASKAAAGVVNVKTNEELSTVYAINIKVGVTNIFVDNDIKVDPTLSYLSVELNKITGAALEEVLGGTESYFIYDSKTLAPVANPGKLLKRVKGNTDGAVDSYLLKIPFKKKTDKNSYVIRFRWQSKDGKRIIETVSNY